MYRTQLGERVLGENEGAVFREMLKQLLEWFDPRDQPTSDEDMTSFGIPVFDRMSYGQKLWALHLVGSALLDKTVPCPPLHAYVEATVATIFTEADVLLDMENEDGEQIAFRSMLVVAATELDDELEEADLQDFNPLVELLEESILWDNDFLQDVESMDDDPRAIKHVRAMMGVPDDYFVEIAHDPEDRDFRPLFNRLLHLVGEEGLPIQRIAFTVHFQARADGLKIINSEDGVEFITDGNSHLQPSIKLWSDGESPLTRECLEDSSWPDGSWKPPVEVSENLKLEDGLLSVSAEFINYSERGEFDLVSSPNYGPFLRSDRDRCLVYPGLMWMRADCGDINSMSMTSVDVGEDALARQLFEGKVSESHDIVVTDISEPLLAEDE